jgi:hypothetical protein
MKPLKSIHGPPGYANSKLKTAGLSEQLLKSILLHEGSYWNFSRKVLGTKKSG